MPPLQKPASNVIDLIERRPGRSAPRIVWHAANAHPPLFERITAERVRHRRHQRQRAIVAAALLGLVVIATLWIGGAR